MAGHTGSATTALGYAGQYTLGQSGLLYLRARFYDPATAQFLTLDPLASISRAPYLYAGDDPANRRDRTGRAAESAEGGCPSPICFPFPTSAEAESAAGAIEALPGEIGGAIESGWNFLTGGGEAEDAGEAGSEKSAGCGAIPEVAGDGKVHGSLPGFPDPAWPSEDLEQIQEDLETSIGRRREQLEELGEEGGHRNRVAGEERLLGQIARRLGGF